MLTARQLLILEFIIQYFTLEGEAVGSKTIVDQTDINASSATVRNEMSVLEKRRLHSKDTLIIRKNSFLKRLSLLSRLLDDPGEDFR